MITEMKTRKYNQKRRAEKAEQTRKRITEAAMKLHGSVGPAEASISAIAREAGVQRLTVYRHFADDSEIFQACTSLWAQHHPSPDPAAWQHLKDPADRTRAALTALYGFFRRSGEMLRLSYRDLDRVPALQGPMRGVDAWLGGIADDLLKPWKPGPARAQVAAVLHHAVRYATWESLSASGLTDTNLAAMVVQWLQALQPARRR
jgi:AcrR family transcriptional regulator